MRVSRGLSTVAVVALVAGCSNVNPPLLFGDEASFGVHLNNDSAAAGMSVSVGFKQRSVAVVPVTVLSDDGKATAVKAHGIDDNRDALSVFAVFDGGGASTVGDTGSQTIKLGQMFSTGLAAQSLTRGYMCLYRKQSDCTPPPPTPQAVAAAAAAAVAAVKAARDAEESSASAKGSAAALASVAANADPNAVNSPDRPPSTNTLQPDASDRPYQRPLVYLRSDVLGFDIGGSVAAHGAQFTLGYASSNVAMIPVASLGAGGKVAGLSGQDNPQSKSKDTYSVFGQFKASTETARLGFGLERFFATGIAARNLADGVQELIAQGEAKGAQRPVAGNADAQAVRTAAKD